MSDIKINEVLERFSKAINYFIEHEANEHENKFFDNVNELINVKADMYKANETKQGDKKALPIHNVIARYLKEQAKKYNVEQNTIIVTMYYGDLHVMRYDKGAYEIWKIFEIIPSNEL